MKLRSTRWPGVERLQLHQRDEALPAGQKLASNRRLIGPVRKRLPGMTLSGDTEMLEDTSRPHDGLCAV